MVTVTPTASGKDSLLQSAGVTEDSRKRCAASAIFVPDKGAGAGSGGRAAGDGEFMDVDIKTHTYDGDTPPTVRQAIRNAGHIVVTNPDMLHSAIFAASYEVGQIV